MNSKQRWLWDEELGDWRMHEFNYQTNMDAKDWLPAGSMINLSDAYGYEQYYFLSEFHREEGK